MALWTKAKQKGASVYVPGRGSTPREDQKGFWLNILPGAPDSVSKWCTGHYGEDVTPLVIFHGSAVSHSKQDGRF
jgi:hypothetical protein